MSKTAKVTCGPMYKAALEVYVGDDLVKAHAFAAGFVSGQAEKVYLGACAMAMFRPSQDRSGMIEDILCDVCPRYGLIWARILDEYSITRKGCEFRFHHLQRLVKDGEVDTVQWHEYRGGECGIPPYSIDPKFHERKGGCD